MVQFLVGTPLVCYREPFVGTTGGIQGCSYAFEVVVSKRSKSWEPSRLVEGPGGPIIYARIVPWRWRDVQNYVRFPQ